MLQILRMNANTTHDKSFKMVREGGINYYLLLLTKTPAYFTFKGEESLVRENSAILLTPHTPQIYRAYGDKYSNDWAWIDCNDHFIQNSRALTNTPTDISSNPHIVKLFEMINYVYYSNQPDKNHTVDYLMRALITMLPKSDEEIKSTPRFDELVALRQKIYANHAHSWSISEMADTLHLSAGYFQSLYTKAFMISANDDVINSRIEYARELLLNSDLSAKQVSIMSGYKNSEHFFRQFKSLTGKSPTEFRNDAKQNK